MSNTDPEFSSKPAALPEPAAPLALLGPAPLFEGEATAAYDELLVRVSGAVKPADIFEEIWVRDIVDLVWEALRLRRLKANLMTAMAYRGLEQILKPLVGFLEAQPGAMSCVGPRNKPRRPDSSSSRHNQTKRKPQREHDGQDKRQSRECTRKHRPDDRSGQSPLGEKCAPPRAQPGRSCRLRLVAGS